MQNFARVVLEVNCLLWSGNVANARIARRKKADGFLSWICLLLNYIRSGEVYTLITILLKNAAVFGDSYKMEDVAGNKFVS